MKDRKQNINKAINLMAQAKLLCDLHLNKIPMNVMDILIERNRNLISALEDVKRNLLNSPKLVSRLDHMIVELSKNIDNIEDYKNLIERNKLLKEFNADFSAVQVQEYRGDDVHGISDELLEQIVMHNVEMKNEGPVEQLKIILNKMSLEEIEAGVSELENQLEKYEVDFNAEQNDEKRLDLGLKMDELEKRLGLMLEGKILKQRIAGENLRDLRKSYDRKYSIAKAESSGLIQSLKEETVVVKEPGEKGYEAFKAESGLKPTELDASYEEHQEMLGKLGVVVEYLKAVEAKQERLSNLSRDNLNELNEKISSVENDLYDTITKKKQLSSEVAEKGPHVTVEQLFSLEDVERHEKDLIEQLSVMTIIKKSKLEEVSHDIEKIEKICAINSHDITGQELDSLEELKEHLLAERAGVEETGLKDKIESAIHNATVAQWEVFFIDEPADVIVSTVNESPEVLQLLKTYFTKVGSQLENDIDNSQLQFLDQKLDFSVAVIEANEMIDHRENYDANKIKDLVSRIEKAKEYVNNEVMVHEIDYLVMDLKSLHSEFKNQRASGKENVAEWAVKGKERMEQTVNQGKSDEIQGQHIVKGPEVD